MDLSEYMELFLVESHEHLENMNDHLLLLEKEPANTSILNEIFRSTHTLKGMAATMKLERITALSHEMETALTYLQEGMVAVTPSVIDLLLKCLDSLNVMMDHLMESGQEPDISLEIIEHLQEMGNECAAVKEEPLRTQELELNDYEISVMEAARKSKYTTYHIKIELDPGTVMKSVRAFMIFRCLEEFGQIIKCVPPVQDLEDENFDNCFELLLISQDDAEIIRTALERISEIESVSLVELDSSLQQDSKQGKSQRKSSSTADIKSVESYSTQQLKTVRVDIDRLDSMLNLVGELVINKTRLEQIGADSQMTDLHEVIEQIGCLTTDLQSLVMKVRMVPIRQVFNRFPRMVRDLSHELNKNVEMILEGEETELDRTVIDEIGDPLVHLIRNALDHGIETQEQRVKEGKPERAVLRLAARQEGNNVIIEVEDDGAGIDIAEIRKQAVSKGFFTLQEGELLDDKTLLDVIFRQGFSTNDTVDDISGRGVGMDVVKSKIESLNGTIDIETERGKGTKVNISLPLTLAIIQALLVTVGEEQYAIPLHSIDETAFLFPEQIKTVQNQEVMYLRDTILPLVRADQLLDVPYVNDNNELFVVVVHKEEQRWGLVVDELVGQQEIVIKPLGNLLAGIPGVAGATILGNGQVSIILDVNSLG
ncbi:MAG TPA: chemotaxis protein CheA [Syntrophomonadaceae bacterium]|nr:chemotaxis protein CheA [Syntrophomonadaceae bacterium]